MEFPKVSLQDWEQLVKKQLKTDDIDSILIKENLENIVVKAYYDNSTPKAEKLPRIEESTHLVAKYNDFLEEDAYAFLIDKDVKVAEKTLFFSNLELANLTTAETNQYVSLVDVFSKDASIDEALVQSLLKNNFKRNIGVDASVYQNAGASLVQQLAIALAKTKDLVEKFGSEILEKLSFKFAIGHQYFLEIAKIRAFKYLFNQLSKEYGLNIFPYIFAETSFRNKANNDEENNLIRSTLELSAAMIGGADAVFANDFKIKNQTKLSEELSFKQMIVLAYESIINVFEDATSGSYVIEDVTRQLSEQAWTLFLDFENKGGFAENIKNGAIQKMIFEQATKEQTWVEEGKIKLIGVNLYPKLEVTKQVSDLYNDNEIKAVRWAEMFE
ncbi:methylmalonyl-CoA mutase [Soonwooa buanensis]|uniref:Methylmalonyl-CoA mutase n=1 Tax=Soonwooa buanensis TaxID=619805 RepID=A0A1T5CGF4_9FLAO|nr:methylmalonyl-CoA mutase family protein [Soonwooa buanensis]SKB58200.1 methylmalonyl-CoA mutase [Soonwooa buanensis]